MHVMGCMVVILFMIRVKTVNLAVWGISWLLTMEGVDRAGHILHLEDRKSTRLNSSHSGESRMPSSA